MSRQIAMQRKTQDTQRQGSNIKWTRKDKVKGRNRKQERENNRGTEKETDQATERIKGRHRNQSETETSEGLIYLTGLPWGTASTMNVWVDYATN